MIEVVIKEVNNLGLIKPFVNLIHIIHVNSVKIEGKIIMKL